MRLLTILAAVLIGLTMPAAGGERVALVIGNSNYTHAPVLANPQNDARLMSATLQNAGFEVTELVDADYDRLKRAMLEFGRKLRDRDIEAALFYYAGHGLQVKGENYLVPVTADMSSEDEVELETINVNDFLNLMESSKAGVNIIILDACRNNPFSASGRSVSRGLAPVDAPKGSYIAYATAPGQVALDGVDGNSPYTKALAAAINEPGLPIERVFKKARAQVQATTGESQVPWETSSITGEFYFRSGGLDDRVTDPSGTSIFDSLTIQRKEAQKPEEKNDALSSLAIPEREPLPSPSFGGETCLDQKDEAGGGVPCVSSILPGQKGNRYGPENLFDDNSATAWVEGSDGDGIGEAVVVRFPEPRTVAKLQIRNGYTKNNDIFSKNNRVRTVVVLDSAGGRTEVRLDDSGDWQTLSLDGQELLSWIAIEIDSVYRGSKYRDTAISELRVQ
jgi:hypothetical protein